MASDDESKTTLYAIIDESVFSIKWLTERDLDHVVTFERDGKRYQCKLGDCDCEHVQALHDAMAAYVAIEARRKAERGEA